MEHEYGLIGGNIFHGELSPDQLFHMRPAPGYADFTTPDRRPLPVLVGDARRRRRDRHPGVAVHPPDPRRRPPRQAAAALARSGAVAVGEPLDPAVDPCRSSLDAVLDPTASRPHAARRGLHDRRGAGLGALDTSSPAPGCAPGARCDLSRAGARVAVRASPTKRAARAGRRRRAARVLQHVPPPRPRAAAVRRDRRRNGAIHCPYHAWTLRPRRRAAHHAALRARPRASTARSTD